jgi:hypothetical protein
MRPAAASSRAPIVATSCRVAIPCSFEAEAEESLDGPVVQLTGDAIPLVHDGQPA